VKLVPVSWKSVLRECAAITVLALFLSLVYNFCSPRGLSIIRTKVQKEVVSDSLLFQSPVAQQPLQIDSARPVPRALARDTGAAPRDVRVVAPLHDKALQTGDSAAMAAAESDRKKQSGLKIVSLEQVRKLLASKRGIFLDARSADDYRKGHITGAHSMPAEDQDNNFPKLVRIPRDTLVVVYCNNNECHLGRTLIEFMRAMEFHNLVLYDDGWDGWTKAKMPVDSTVVE
jgi:rhodanese-related sulfurtransferase